MKKILMLILISIFVQMVFISCEKGTTELPPSEYEKTDIEKDILHYKAALVSYSQGWFFRYKPSENSEEILISLRFFTDGKMSIRSSTRSNLTTNTEASYTLDGKYVPAITFSQNSVFKYLTEKLDGALKFNIKKLDDGRFALVRSDGYNTVEYYLEPLTSSHITQLDHKIDSIRAVIENERVYEISKNKWRELIRKNTSLYRFKNIVFEEFGAMFTAIDTNDRWIEIEFMTPYNVNNRSYLVTKQKYYYNHTVEGISFNQPIVYNGFTIPEFIFDEFDEDDDSKLIISTDGVTSSGYIGYDNSPGYYYQDMQDFFNVSKWSVDGGVMVTKTSGYKSYFLGDWSNLVESTRTALQGTSSSFELGIVGRYVNNQAANTVRIQLWSNTLGSTGAQIYWSATVDLSVPNHVKFTNITYDSHTTTQTLTAEKKQIATAFVQEVLGDPKGYSLFKGPAFGETQQSIMLYSTSNANNGIRFVLQTGGSNYNAYRNFNN